MTALFLLLVLPPAAFGLGALWSNHRNINYVKSHGCPFQQACLHYDSIHTKEAVKRVLTLMLNNNVPQREIKNIIDNTLK